MFQTNSCAMELGFLLASSEFDLQALSSVDPVLEGDVHHRAFGRLDIEREHGLLKISS